MTRSTAPMSMPSSSDDVATTARSSPPLSAASISSLCSLDTEPWWARANSSPARLLIPLQMRSASRRELAKTIVLRRCRIRSTGGGGGPQRTRAPRGLYPARPRPVSCLPFDEEVELTVGWPVDDRDGSCLPGVALGVPAAQEAGDLLEGALGRGEPDPLRWGPGHLLEHLEGEGELGTALGPGD